MKIVIEIPDEYKKHFDENRCKEKFDSLATNEFGYILRKAFENGTPLPNVHEMREATPNAIYSCMAKAKRRGGGCIYQRIRVEKEEEDERCNTWTDTRPHR